MKVAAGTLDHLAPPIQPDVSIDMSTLTMPEHEQRTLLQTAAKTHDTLEDFFQHYTEFSGWIGDSAAEVIFFSVEQTPTCYVLAIYERTTELGSHRTHETEWHYMVPQELSAIAESQVSTTIFDMPVGNFNKLPNIQHQRFMDAADHQLVQTYLGYFA